MSQLNHFTTGLFLNPLKTSENQRVFMFLGGIERESDVKWINLGVFLELGIRKSSPENFCEFQNFVTFTEEIFNRKLLFLESVMLRDFAFYQKRI